MNVLVCIPCLLVGGTEIQTLNLVQALVEGGHKVTTVCYFEHCEKMVMEYRNAGSEIILLSKDGVRPTGKRMLLFLWKGLKKAVKLTKPDIAHVQYMAPGAYPILMLKLLGVKNIIATAHTSADIYPNLHLIHFIQRYCVRAFTCITERAEKSFFGESQLYSIDCEVKKRNHFTIYNSLPKNIRIRVQPKIWDSINTSITIGVVSRLEPIKGMDLVIPAFAKVHAEHPNTNLLVVGDGSLRQSMECQVKEAGLTDSVEFAGRKQGDELEQSYDRIDILLMPSRSEGFGLTAIEGMARGCVVVASDTGGLPEVVKNGVVGLLHRVEDIDDMSEKICSLIERNCQARVMNALSDNAIEYVRRFSPECLAKSFNSLYSKVLSHNPSI